MKVFKSYIKGLGEASLRPKMVFVIWLFNAAFGALLYFRLSGLFSEAIGKSLVGERLAERMDFSFLSELLVHHGASVSGVLSVALLLAGAYFFVSIFLVGGILNTLVFRPQPESGEARRQRFAGLFFEGGGRFFGRFFRLCVYSILLWIAAILILLVIVAIGRALTAEGTKEQLAFILVIVEVILGLFLVNLIRMILDYARIRIVTEDSRRVFVALLKGAGFVFRNFGKTLGLYYLLALTGVLVAGLYGFANSTFTKQSLAAVMGGFLIGQIFIALRAWLKIAFQASQLNFFRLSRGQPANQKSAEPSPSPLTSSDPAA